MELEGFWDKFIGRHTADSFCGHSHGVRLQSPWNSPSLEGTGFNLAQGLEVDI